MGALASVARLCFGALLTLVALVGFIACDNEEPEPPQEPPERPTCMPGKECPDDRYCAVAGCSGPPADGVAYSCVELPECVDGGRPVCGCDGHVYANSDCARAAKQGRGCAWDDRCEYHCPLSGCETLPCATPTGFHPCGPLFCDLETEYCLLEGCFYDFDKVTCAPLPKGCDGEDPCTCLWPSTCTGDRETGVTVKNLILAPDLCTPR
jgi:hypothetical protein